MVLIDQDMITAQHHYQQPHPVGGGGGFRKGRPSKLYVGNLASEVTELGLKDFFSECGVHYTLVHRIFLKKGFAFVEFVDEPAANLAVESCNGKPYLNTVVRVEHANQQQNETSTTRFPRQKLVQLLFSNCNAGTSVEEVRNLIAESGTNVVSIEEVRSTIPGSSSFVARIASMKFAQIAMNKWNQKIVAGSRIQVKIMEESFTDGGGDPAHQPIHAYIPRNTEFSRPTGGFVDVATEVEEYDGYEGGYEGYDIPLRIMIPNEFIGAVIGRGGATIRAISKGTGARLDIFRHFNRNYDMPEKPVSLTGPPERVTQACKKILEIIAQEADHQRERRGDIALKMFAPNSVVGRIIGRSGTVIKQIMDDTQTKIHISNQPDFIEENAGRRRSNQRLITIRGSIDGMSQAESIISEKLHEAYGEGKLKDGDLDLGLIFNGPGNAIGMTNSGDPYQNSHGIPHPEYPYQQRNNLVMGAMRGGYPASLNTSNQGLNLCRPETGYMYVPEESVGALIGRKGSSIRQIIHASGASIKVLDGVVMINELSSRRVVIHGGIESLFFAEYLIYQKVMDEGKAIMGQQMEDPQLTVEMAVPSEVVGRLIGKNGINIREIQRQHYCHCKFLTEPDLTIPLPNEGETFCRITGTSHAFLLAQKKIRSLLVKAMNKAFTRSNNDGNGSSNETVMSTVEQEPTKNLSSMSMDISSIRGD